MLAGKTIGALAVIGIAGVTGAVGVLVSGAAATRRVAHGQVGSGELPATRRPQLTATRDVRTTALHRAHLQAAEPVDCASCHDLAAREFRAPPVATCLSCHPGDRPAVHRGAPEALCFTCHDFLAPDDAPARARRCERCHDRAQGAYPAIAVHRAQGCATCHPVHPRASAVPADCVGCHAARATAHPASGPGRALCRTCHLPHRPASDALVRCQSCHVAGAGGLPAAPRVPSTALSGGHDRCRQCHAGHGFTRASVKPCRDCHTGKHVLASDRVAAHAACTSCHDPHAARSTPAARCATCHAAIAASSKHPRDPGGRDCVGCHPPHQELGPSRAALGCTDRCHSDRRGTGHASAGCSDCHRRHRFLPEKAAPALCLDCHARPTGNAPAIATSEGHARCTNCHLTAAHRPAAARPACGTCHEAESRAAPTGHANCRTCHEVHTGRRRPEAARCESCHADRARTPHARMPGGCQGCHRPHGPNGPATPPPCARCHPTPTLTGLHLATSHRTCSACHSAHAPAVAGREPCLRCHADRRDHVPAARLCQACHPFGAEPRVVPAATPGADP